MERKRNSFSKRNGIVKRVFSFILAFAMIITMTQIIPGGGIIAKAASEDVSVGSETSEGSGIYNVTFTYVADEALTSCTVAGSCFDNWATTKQLTNTSGNTWSGTFELAEGSYEYQFKPNDQWTGAQNSTVTVGNPAVPTTDLTVSNGKATFTYSPNDGQTHDVTIKGSYHTSDWSEEAISLTDADGSGTYTVTIDVAPGSYEYKFVIDGNYESGNNRTFVVPGLQNSSVEVLKGVATDLPAQLTLYAEGGNTSKDVTYTLATTAAASYVTLSGGKITVDSSYTGKTLELTAADDSGNTSTVTLNLVDKLYNYTIYYYDWTADHMSADASSLWIWQDGGAGGVEYPFTGTEVLSDGNTWLKAEVTLSYYNNIQIIPKISGQDVWTWQDSTKSYSNTAQDENSTIYLISGKTSVYTSIPELIPPRERSVVVEYDRPAGDYDGWNIYSWNTGITSETELYAEEKNGKHYITVPVADYDVDLLLSFCMRKCSSIGANDWLEKDGGDHYINVPTDQTVVKARFVQDEGIVEILPYNTGYEMDGANDQIHFYYRDDELFKDGTLDTLQGKVQVVVNGTTYDMEYDAVNERYYYDYKGLVSGDYEYHYIVDGEEVLDLFNSRTSADGTNSVLTYKKYSLGIEASVLNPSMDYNDNNVLSVSFTGNDSSVITTEEIAGIEADLTALGVGTIDVDTGLMKATIACLYSTALGEKTIPVTLTDIYGNIYTANATVTITERVKAEGDFDWDEAIIYFAVTDRFFDGNTGNNDGVDKDGSLSYHGGDFAGLNQKLDYLKDLGVNTIWITPIVENSDTTTEKDGETIESTGYHGYWASDFTTLNSHLGTPEEFSALLDAAHARGMKIMVDVVINHAGYETEEYFNSILNGVTMIRDSSNTVSGSDVYAALSGLPDFVTEDAAVRNQLVQWQTDWMDQYDIDYYRVDTVKHVDATTWAAFKNSLTAVNPDFKMTGEYSGAGYANTAGELGTGRMDALLDFDFNGWAADFLTGNISTVESSLAKRNTAINNTATMSSFINSHDEDGLQYTLQNEKKLTAEEAKNLMKVAATLTITAKGQPVIYYGEELGQYGQNNYPYQTNRYDFDWDELAVQQADSNSIYNHYKTMLAIRNGYSELFARGDRQSVLVSDENGYDVFSRSYGGTTLYVGMNIQSEAQTLAIPVSGSVGSTYKDLYSGASYTVAADGTISVTIPAAANGGTVVLVADDQENANVEKFGDTSSDGSVSVSLGDSVNTLMNIVFTETELADIASGKKASIYLTVENISNTVSERDKALVQKAAQGYTIGAYLDLNLFKQVEGSEAVPVKELSSKITVNITIPKDLLNTDSNIKRTYAIVRVHNDEASLIEGSFNEQTGSFTFKTDAFSTYAIVYKDEAVKASTSNVKGAGTGDNTPIAATVMVILFGSVMVAAGVGKKRKMTR